MKIPLVELEGKRGRCDALVQAMSGGGQTWHERLQLSGSPKFHQHYHPCSVHITRLTKALLQTSQDSILQKQREGQSSGNLEAGGHRRAGWGGNSPSVDGQEQAGEEPRTRLTGKPVTDLPGDVAGVTWVSSCCSSLFYFGS